MQIERVLWMLTKAFRFYDSPLSQEIHKEKMSFIRFAILTFSIFLISACTGVEYIQYNAATEGIADGAFLRKLLVAKSDVKTQAPSEMGVNSGGLHCVFVETDSDIYFLKYSQRTLSYEPLMHFKIKEIPAVAYATYGLRKQVQVKMGKRWMGFQIVGKNFADIEATRGVYDRLLAHGVSAAEPQSFIGM
jgi:hypothetical protein